MTDAKLRNEPVSVLPEILDLYSENGSENVAELLIAICEEHPQAIIKAGGVDIFRSEIYNTQKELASIIDPWSSRELQAVAEEEPSEVLEDLQAIGELLKIYSDTESTKTGLRQLDIEQA